MKIVVVGGGSTYTPELVDGLGRMRDLLPVEELVLVDPVADRLELVAGLGRRILARLDHPARLVTSTDLAPALDGAAAVLVQLRVGGQAARLQDETWPLECGCVGQETTGAGGLAKALRTVPVVLDIARQVREAAPDAWIVDFTNPVGIVTRALLRDGHRAVGLCNVAIGFQRRFAQLLDVAPDRVELGHVGLNHLTWERSAVVDGVDRLPEILARHADDLAADIGLPSDLLRAHGMVPSYYLRYFYAHDEVVRELLDDQPRAAQVAALEEELLRMYADPALDRKPDLFTQRGGAYYSEAAVQLAAALLGSSGGSTQVVNVRNDGTLPFLADDAVIEVPARVDGSGVTALPVAPLEPLYAGLVAAVTAYEDLALDAALRGGRQRVFDALLAHPLVGQVDLAAGLTDRLIAHNREHLPWA
ncbi:6-phospho-beta-glucosidase [Nocardioides sp. URHA0032]|uniref:6-phospho-beta-glucosidase n=1 Tax=Nocardioides sp. URHA0032 TaxID=1380388 RepID=UPI00048E81E3|nr:6-phospho-beta-glucosidase [Nocardioides sp. URHA0032]